MKDMNKNLNIVVAGKIFIYVSDKNFELSFGEFRFLNIVY